MSESEHEEEDSFDDKEFLSTKPPPADVHNASTAVANLPSTLLDSLRSPHAKLDSAAISELLAATSSSTSAELDSLPLLDEPVEEDDDDDLPIISLADEPEQVHGPFLAASYPSSYVPVRPKPLVLVSLALGAALVLVGAATWIVVGFFQ